jgi:hypothetical protein
LKRLSNIGTCIKADDYYCYIPFFFH